MRRDGGNSTHFLIIRKRNIWAWRTDNPNRIEALEEISICAQAIWHRKSPVSEAIVRKIEQILPVGRISDAQRSIVESGLRSVIPFVCPNLLPLSAACGHGRACWRPDPVANDPRRTSKIQMDFCSVDRPLLQECSDRVGKRVQVLHGNRDVGTVG
jgi:hypothetical protein